MADLVLRLIGEDSASGAFDNVGGAAKKAAAVIYDFAKDSLKAFADVERIERQLTTVAKENTEAFEARAEVMERQLSVDAEAIKSMDTLLLRYGTAPEQVERTTRALLDYAAATGGDAESATMALVRGLEKGSDGIRQLGIQFESTGDKSKDLELAIEALNNKFGGAAETDARSLSGRVRAADIAMGNLKETVGGLLATVDSKLGVLDKLSSGLGLVSSAIANWDWDAWGKFTTDGGLSFGGTLLPAFLASMASRDRGGSTALVKTGRPDATGVDIGIGTAEIVERTRFSAEERKSPADKALEESLMYAKARDRMRAYYKSEDEFELQQEERANRGAERQRERIEDAQKLYEKQLDDWNKQDEALQRKVEDRITQNETRRLEQLERQAQIWENAGARIGEAFVTALADQLDKLAAGGEFDVGEFMASLASVILTIAGAAIGGYVGGPTGAQVGGTLGSLAGTGIQALERMNKKDKRHDGGWVEKFHSGGWPGLYADEQVAVLQSGERVLSRSEVARMGGPGGVDSAARGRGSGLNVYVSTIDAVSTREFFENQGGRGFYNALRTGRGNLSGLFAGG